MRLLLRFVYIRTYHIHRLVFVFFQVEFDLQINTTALSETLSDKIPRILQSMTHIFVLSPPIQ